MLVNSDDKKERPQRTMTVLPLYWMTWQDRPTSFPPPKQRNMSSSAGSTGSSGTVDAMADALRFEAIVPGVLDKLGRRYSGSLLLCTDQQRELRVALLETRALKAAMFSVQYSAPATQYAIQQLTLTSD